MSNPCRAPQVGRHVVHCICCTGVFSSPGLKSDILHGKTDRFRSQPPASSHIVQSHHESDLGAKYPLGAIACLSNILYPCQKCKCFFDFFQFFSKNFFDTPYIVKNRTKNTKNRGKTIVSPRFRLQFFEFISKRFAFLVVAIAGRALEFLEQAFLVGGEVFRHLHHQAHDLVAGAAAV